MAPRLPTPEASVFLPTFRCFPNDRISSWVLRAIHVGALIAIASRVLGAQDSAVALRPGVAVGVSAGLPGVGSRTSFELTTIGLSVTRVHPLELGYDLSIGTVPRAFVSGAAAVGVRAGVVLPVPITRQVMLLPGAGASLVGVTDFAGAGGTAGWNLNLGLLAALTHATAVRTGVSVHQFSESTRGIWLYEFGIAWLH